MKLIFATLFLILSTHVIGQQAQEPEQKTTPRFQPFSMRKPTVSSGATTDYYQITGVAPYLWFTPSGSAPGWGSSFIQLGVDATGCCLGDYFAFSIGETADTKKFFFNRGIDVINNDGSGSTVLYVGGGTGSSSSQNVSLQLESRMTNGHKWSQGMFGTQDFRIRDGGNDRMTISSVDGTVTFSGTVQGGNIIAKYQDLAEWVETSRSVTPGTVVVVSRDLPNVVTEANRAYDTAVAGVVSEQPGITLGVGGPNKAKIATTGRVRVKVDATQQPIEIGDLLVTSNRPGYAMKSQPLSVGGAEFHRPGTLIGKALEPLHGGTGEVLVLLSLQ